MILSTTTGTVFFSIAHFFEQQCSRTPEKDFLIYYDELGARQAFTYQVFREKVLQIVGLLQQKGIVVGDRVAIAAHNHSDTVLQYFAAWYLGACVVPLNMTEDDDRLRFILYNSKTKLVFVREEYVDRISAITSEIEIQQIVVNNNYYLQCPQQSGSIHHENLQNHTESEALIVYTSGTTGNPKGVVLVQRNLFDDAQSIMSWHRISPETRMMCILPIHHVNGTVVTLFTPFVAGASVVLNRKFQTEFFFERIIHEKVNIVSVVPTILAYLLQANVDAQDCTKNGFRHIICGAGPLTCELAHSFYQRYGIRIVHGYGLSETTCYSCFLPLDIDEIEYKKWMQEFGFPSIGVPLPCNEMDIHSSEGHSIPEGEKGEIVIRGSNVMKEYYENPTANASAFEFGWFRSGDEGFYKVDQYGRKFFFITGRIKELIIRGGVNISPLEIDEVLSKIPGVQAGISVGFDNNFYGEEVGALVIRENNNVTDSSVIEYCLQHLPFHKCPKVVLFTDQLPITTTGKYQRNKVKHLFSEWKDVQFKKTTLS